MTTAFEYAIEIERLRSAQWHLNNIGSYSTANTLQPEIDRLTKLAENAQEERIKEAQTCKSQSLL